VPDAVAKPDQSDAREQHEIAMREADQQIRKADPEERHRHQHAFAAYGVDHHAARDVGDGRGDVLAGDDQADLAVGEAELVADERQQQVEGRRIPVRERMAGSDQPQLAPGAEPGIWSR
jgi:hypothetical protein